MASKLIKNRSKIEAQDEVALSIDVGSILMGFERQVGMENRAKSDPKWIGKRIEKIIKKEVRLEGVLGRFWVEKFKGGEGGGMKS